MAKSPTDTRGESQSPKQSSTSPNPQDVPAHKDAVNSTAVKGSEADRDTTTKPLAPPPRPSQQQNGNTPDYFGSQLGGSLNLEPNPFEQSFGGAPPETPGGTKLPSVAALTSPSALLPGGGSTPFNWGGGSLRTGPLSPAMLSGPAGDYFGDTHLRGGFPTPNESSLRTGLTPGGSGSMFPAPSPNSQALFALQSGGATPSTLDFHRTAISAAAKRDSQPQSALAVTSQPQDIPNGVAAVKPEAKAPSGPFDPHDNDAANGLFLLAQGRNGVQGQTQFPVQSPQQGHAHPVSVPASQSKTSPQMNGGGSHGSGSVRNGSDAGSAMSEEIQPPRPNTRGKGKRNSGAEATTTNGRRKASDAAVKAPPTKKAKTNGGSVPTSMAMSMDMDDDDDEDDDDDDDDDKPGKDGQPKQKMTEEEKRKNFLERNRVAALKCRQRKKQWLANLQTKVEMYSSENDNLTMQINQLREEVVNLKTLLLAHKDCPVAQQQGLTHAFMQQGGMDSFNQQMNPYNMAAPQPMPQQLVGVGQRRFE